MRYFFLLLILLAGCSRPTLLTTVWLSANEYSVSTSSPGVGSSYQLQLSAADEVSPLQVNHMSGPAIDNGAKLLILVTRTEITTWPAEFGPKKGSLQTVFGDFPDGKKTIDLSQGEYYKLVFGTTGMTPERLYP